MAMQIARWQFTVDDYHRMQAAGILTEDDRVELIDGEVRRMSPIGPLHAAIVKRLNTLLMPHMGTLMLISLQDPIQLNDVSEPEPDIAILRYDASYYAQHHPTPEAVLFVTEVADTLLDYDRDEKLPRYAEAGIREAWIVDVEAEIVVQYTQAIEHRYLTRREYRRGDSITSVAAPTITSRSPTFSDDECPTASGDLTSRAPDSPR
ncbi:MAG: Uma2 family endonuclease [Chloroflexi bacterium]|nr:Uma2 family endonuclease [Chloroflexota bacterium]